MKALVGRGEGLSLIQILGSSILSTEPLELSDPSVLCGSCHVLAFALLPQLDHKLPKGRGLSYTLGVSLPGWMLRCMVLGLNSYHCRALELIPPSSLHS